MIKIIYWLYLMNIIKSQIAPVFSLHIDNSQLCPINECRCDSGQSVIACDQNIPTLANKNLAQFKSLIFNNFTRLNGRSFENAHFSSLIDSLFIGHIKLLQSNTWSWSSNLPDIKINNLHLSFSSDIIIEPNSFDYLICDTLVLTCFQCQNNQALSLNNFGENTQIKHLILDFQTIVNTSSTHTSNLFKNNLDRFNKMSDYNQNVPYDEYWSTWYTEADIEHVLVKNVKGIYILDYKYLPNFKNLAKIQIINTDLNEISETFALLHSKNLKSLVIQESNIEYIKSNVFETLTNLEFLDLSFNPIKKFELLTFNGLGNLKTLNLNGLKENIGFTNEDLCMLSYLPCKIDLKLDIELFGSEENCAIVYLSEIKFKRLISSRQISPCNNLTDELAVCFKMSNRNMNDSCINSYSNDLILADVQFVRSANATTTTSPTTKLFKTSKTSTLAPKFFNHKFKFDQMHHQNDSFVKNNLVENNNIETSTKMINEMTNSIYKPITLSLATILSSTVQPKREETFTTHLEETNKQSSLDTSTFNDLPIEISSIENVRTTAISKKPRKEENLVLESSSTQFISESSTMETSLNFDVTTEEDLTDKPLTTTQTQTDLEYTSKRKSLEMLNRKDANIHNHLHNPNNNELLYVIIIALVIFCMIQFLIGVFIFYLFFANKWNPSASVGSNQFLSKNTEIGVGDSEEPLDSTPVAANQSILHTILLNAQQQQQQQQQQPSSSTINLAMPGVRLGEGTSSSNIDTIYLEKNKANSNSKNYRNKNKTIKNLYRPPIQFLRDTQSTLSLKWKSFLS